MMGDDVTTGAAQMGYFRYRVEGGEFVVQGDRYWQITFNGTQIGGMFRAPQDALDALARLRRGLIPGPDLGGIDDPPSDFRCWETPPSIMERYVDAAS